MLLSNPVCITPRLMAGVRVGEAWVSIDYAKRQGRDGRTRYHAIIDLPDGTECECDDLQSGCQGGDLQQGLTSLLSFLSACGESVAYAERTGGDGENANLFPVPVAQWARENIDELASLSLELEEGEELIQE